MTRMTTATKSPPLTTVRELKNGRSASTKKTTARMPMTEYRKNTAGGGVNDTDGRLNSCQIACGPARAYDTRMLTKVR